MGCITFVSQMLAISPWPNTGPRALMLAPWPNTGPRVLMLALAPVLAPHDGALITVNGIERLSNALTVACVHEPTLSTSPSTEQSRACLP